MTQYFTYRGFSLGRAPLQLKVLATAFIAMMVVGVGVGLLNYQVRTGLTARGSEAWYRSGQASSPAAAGTEGGEMPIHAKTPLELLDATHPHLFNQAFLFFVLGHLLALCSVRPSIKMGVYLAGFGGILIDAASPWLIRFATPQFSWLQLAGHVAMVAALAGLVGLPLREMWGPAGRRGAAETGP